MFRVRSRSLSFVSMPTYDYRCPNGHDFEHFFRKISDAEAELVCPESMLGSMAALSLRKVEKQVDPAELHRRLVFEQRVEIPVHAWPEPHGPLLRISAHAYNELADYERLAEAVVALLGD